jgi:serine/threonine-protein kinase
MGEVFLANSVGAAGFAKLVTVKMLRRHASDDLDRVRELVREAFIGVRLDHENIVQVLDLDQHDAVYFVVMEYVRGFSLRDVISFANAQGEPLPIAPVIHVARCIADALDYVHHIRGPRKKHLGLIHRDVSPSNILLGAEGRIKLADFGVALVASDASGPLIGKPKYLPPEAAHGETPTQGWDVYALAVVIHAALTGEVDLDRSSPHAIGPALRSLLEARPDCPPAIGELVARDPTARIVDAASFRRALDEVMPRRADDAEQWRSFVQSVYQRERFIARYGLLPHIEDLIPDIESSGPVEKAPAGYEHTAIVEKPLRFGMSPARGIQAARAQGERVAGWLRKRLDRDVRAVVLADYHALTEALVDGQIDFAWMPPIPFLSAAERGAGVLAVFERDGRPAYESAIFVRDDAPIREVSDLASKSMGFVDRDSASGYLFAADLIMRALGRPEHVLREHHFHGSHQAVCEAVVRGWTDAGTTYAVRDRGGRLLHSGWLDLPAGERDKLRAIAFAGPIPCDNLAHRPGLQREMIDGLARALVETSDAEGLTILGDVFHTTGMLRADLRLYDPLRVVLRRTTKLAS